MARLRNLLATKQITISTTQQVEDHLGHLARSGLWGKNAADAAERLIADQIRRFIQDGTLERRGQKR